MHLVYFLVQKYFIKACFSETVYSFPIFDFISLFWAVC